MIAWQYYLATLGLGLFTPLIPETSAIAGRELPAFFSHANADGPAVYTVSVQLGNGFHCCIVIRHYYIRQSFGGAGEDIGNNTTGGHLAKFGKKVSQVFFTKRGHQV
jgi:hypothetical protein